MALTARQAVELFHLVFLRALVARGEDKSLFAVKGGSNLRFFFGSVRYSEDLDLDVVVVARGTLKNKIERLLASPAVTAPLAAHGVTLTDVSAPKQTDTTQRWKAGLLVAGAEVPYRTKIEFSRRHAAALEGAAFEAVLRDVVRPYAIAPFLANHYAAARAVAQKIQALAGRADPQARDVFDLHLLFARPDTAELRLSAEHTKLLPRALERAIGISYDDYASKVVAYLEPSQAGVFRERHAWEAMQQGVVDRLEALAGP